MDILDNITYEYIIDLTKYFLEKYDSGEIKSLDQITNIVKSRVPSLMNFSYIFD